MLHTNSSGGAYGLKAIAAVNRLSRRGPERNLRCHAALGTHGFVKFPGGRDGGGLLSAPTRRGSRALLFVSTPATSRRFVLKSTFLVERLLPRGKDKLFAAVTTFQNFVLLSHETSVTPLPAGNENPPAGETRRGHTWSNRGVCGTGQGSDDWEGRRSLHSARCYRISARTRSTLTTISIYSDNTCVKTFNVTWPL